jgi:hypothetical protein
MVVLEGGAVSCKRGSPVPKKPNASSHKAFPRTLLWLTSSSEDHKIVLKVRNLFISQSLHTNCYRDCRLDNPYNQETVWAV